MSPAAARWQNHRRPRVVLIGMSSSLQLFRSSALVLSLALITACDESFTGPTYPLDSRFTLAPGETAGIEQAGIRVQFHAVEGDSRCPADVLCIQGGDALVRISVLSSDGQSDYELHTGDMRPVRHDELTIALEELSPYPFSSRAIDPGEYRATLRVTR